MNANNHIQVNNKYCSNIKPTIQAWHKRRVCHAKTLPQCSTIWYRIKSPLLQLFNNHTTTSKWERRKRIIVVVVQIAPESPET